MVRVPTTLALFSNYNIAFSCVQSLVQCLSLYIIHTFYRFCINIVCAHNAFDEPITHTNHYIENSGLNRTKNKEEYRRTRRRSALGLPKWTQFFDESLCLLRIHANTPKIYAAFSRNKQPPPPIPPTNIHTHRLIVSVLQEAPPNHPSNRAHANFALHSHKDTHSPSERAQCSSRT